MAYSSISLITLLADVRSTVLSSLRRLRSAPESGTCLTSTTMFIVVRRPPKSVTLAREFSHLSDYRSTSQLCVTEHLDILLAGNLHSPAGAAVGELAITVRDGTLRWPRRCP